MTDYAVDYEKLLRLFVKVVQSSVPDFSDEIEWRNCSHAIAYKLYRHLLTMGELCGVRQDKWTLDDYVDIGSVKVLERSIFENYLVFSHIYRGGDLSLSSLRYDIWKYCGLMSRQNFKPETSKFENQIETEKLQAQILWSKIIASPLFVSYNKKQQTRLHEGDWLGINKMSLLADEAGLRFFYNKIYRHTSGYGHSGYIAVLQTSQSRDPQIQSQLAEIGLATGLVVMTHFLSIICSLSVIAKEALDSDAETHELFEKWYFNEASWNVAVSRD